MPEDRVSPEGSDTSRLPNSNNSPEQSAVPSPVLSRRALLTAGAALATLTACSARSGARTTPSAAAHSPTAPTSSGSARPVASPPSASATAPTRHLALGPAREIGRGTGARPEVALTFHGAGDPNLGREILSALHGARTKATIMAVGTWLDAQPVLAKAFLADGHELGNHTWSHPTLDTLDRSAVKAEIERCRDKLAALTGSAGRYFRQSGSQHSTPLIRELAGAAGYSVCLSYDIDSLDWTDPGPDAVVANARAATAGSVISLHLGHPGTVVALPRIISELRARGLQPVTAAKLLQP